MPGLPWSTSSSFPLLFSPPLPLWCFLPFLKQVFTEAPPSWLTGSAVPCGWFAEAGWNWLCPAQAALASPHRGRSCCRNLAMGTQYGFCLHGAFSSVYVHEFILNKCVSAQESGLCRNSKLMLPLSGLSEKSLSEKLLTLQLVSLGTGEKRSRSQHHAVIPQVPVPLCHKP